MKQYIVSADFKNHVTGILNKSKYALVFPYMNLINRDGFLYSEGELNDLVQFLGEFPYSEVAEFFLLLPTLVKEFDGAYEMDKANAEDEDGVTLSETLEDPAA